MAVSNISIAQISGAYLFNDSANGATVVAVKASSGTIYEMELDNSANGAATYFKLFNVAAGSVVRPNFVVPSGKLVAGVPAKIVRDLTKEELEEFENSANRYREYAKKAYDSIERQGK